MSKYAIAIHGGAGTISRKSMTPEKEKEYKDALGASLKAGSEVLEKGGSALDAIEAAVVSLEDCPLFNAGKGAVFTNNGEHEMDASIMWGKDLEAGAITFVKGIKNPIRLARAAMERSEFVFLSGQGAADFAKKEGLEFMPDEYFFTQFRYDQLKEAIAHNRAQLDHTESGDEKYSTVGAVALDRDGNLAAATSTGGLTNKQYGRIGDSSVIGAGTYANNNTCAISGTGYGEFYIRGVVAYDVSCLMEYKGLSLAEACRIVIHDKQASLGGDGGLIAIDKNGNIELPFNSEGMYRGWKKEGEDSHIKIYNE